MHPTLHDIVEHAISPENSMVIDPPDDDDRHPSPVGGSRMELDDDLHLGAYSPLINNNTVHHCDVSGTLTSLGKRSWGDMDGDRDSNNGDTNPNMNAEGSSPTSPLRCEGLIPASPCDVDVRTMGGQLHCFGTAPCNQNATQVLPASPALLPQSKQGACCLGQRDQELTGADRLRDYMWQNFMEGR